ncbi:hypothetical protein TNCV_815541 [Trichonephila clavipes]|nr:hypothetical protein TNCV_815541 [Trichonephila clavipes]
MAALWSTTEWSNRQQFGEESPAKPFRVYVLLRHRLHFSGDWNLARFLHSISGTGAFWKYPYGQKHEPISLQHGCQNGRQMVSDIALSTNISSSFH